MDLSDVLAEELPVICAMLVFPNRPCHHLLVICPRNFRKRAKFLMQSTQQRYDYGENCLIAQITGSSSRGHSDKSIFEVLCQRVNGITDIEGLEREQTIRLHSLPACGRKKSDDLRAQCVISKAE